MNKGTQFTPGRWHVDGFNTHAVISGQDEGGRWPRYQHVCTCDYGYLDPEKYHDLNQANARLIAAAPEMYADLVEIMSLNLELPYGLKNHIKDVINKVNTPQP